jgi:hypothetical protein
VTEDNRLCSEKSIVCDFLGNSAVIFEDISKTVRSDEETQPEEAPRESEEVLNEEQKPLFEVKFSCSTIRTHL